MNRVLIAVFALIAVLAAGGLVFLTMSDSGEAPTRSTGKALVGGDFTLVNQDGETVTAADFKGKLTIVYFGFTFCPDVCPTALQTISAALDQLGRKADEVTPIFITVDPERDDVAAMKSYVAHFHPSLVGLTGTPEQVAEAAKAYKVYYRKVEDPTSSAAYTVDHSSIVFLMDRDGAYITNFPHGTSPDTMAAAIREHL